MVLYAMQSWRRSLPLLLSSRTVLAWHPLAQPRPSISRLSSIGEAMEEYRRWARDSSLSVTSSSNARVKAAKQLHSSNGRKKTGLVLLEGLRLCCDALEASFVEDSTVPAPTSVLVDPTAFESPEGARLEAALQRLPWGTVATTTAEVLADVATTNSPQGVVLTMPRPVLPWNHRARLVLVLDGVRDPGNLGTLVRSAAACGAGGVLLVGGCTDPWATKALRSSMGASLRIPLASASDWPTALSAYLAPERSGSSSISSGTSSDGLWLHAADARPAATPYFEVNWSQGRHALVVGTEAAGLSPWLRNAADAAEGSNLEVSESVRIDYVSIPLASAPHSLSPGATENGAHGPAVESLNAAVAGSIVLCEAHRQIITTAK